MLGELVFRGGDGEAFLAAGHGGEALTHADGFGQVLVEPLVHLGLVVVEVHLRGAADHVQVNDVLGFGREVSEAGEFLGGGVLLVALFAGAAEGFTAHERGERGPADSVGALAEEVAAGFVLDVVLEGVHGESRFFCFTADLGTMPGFEESVLELERFSKGRDLV